MNHWRKKFWKPWKCFGRSFESLYNDCPWYELCFNCFLGCLYKFMVFIFQLLGKLFWWLGRLVRLMVLKSMYLYSHRTDGQSESDSQIRTVCMIRSGRSGTILLFFIINFFWLFWIYFCRKREEWKLAYFQLNGMSVLPYSFRCWWNKLIQLKTSSWPFLKETTTNQNQPKATMVNHG